MKTFIKAFGVWAIIILMVVFLFYVLADVKEGYRCFAELYPEKAEQQNIPALGETIVDKGIKFRLMAEAKHPEEDQWIHWLDVEPLDDICNYAVSIHLTEDGNFIFQVIGCNSVSESIKEYCAKEGRNIDDMKHYAEPIVLKFKPGTQDI